MTSSQNEVSNYQEVSAPRTSFEKISRKGFDNPNSQECFANALLQCLYHLNKFKNVIFSIKHPENILKRLRDLFQTLDQANPSQELIENKKDEFLQEVKNNSPEVKTE